MAVNMLRGASGASKVLLDDKDYFDDTIARDDDLTPPSNEQFEAHRVIDSACGPFLKNILKVIAHKVTQKVTTSFSEPVVDVAI